MVSDASFTVIASPVGVAPTALSHPVFVAMIVPVTASVTTEYVGLLPDSMVMHDANALPLSMVNRGDTAT